MPSPTSESPTRTAFKAGGAAVLLCTGIIFLAARLFFDVYELIDGEPLEKPGSFAVGMMFAGLVFPFLALASLVFTFYIGLTRCTNRMFGFSAALVALLLMTMPFLLMFTGRDFQIFVVLLPAVLLGKLTGSSAGGYLGVTIQLGVGAWLVGWLDRFMPKNGRVTDSETVA